MVKFCTMEVKVMKRKAIILFIILIMVIILLGVSLLSDNLLFYINYGVYLPNPSSVKTIYRFDYREGEDFFIWSYNDSKFMKAISKKEFNKINDSNIDFVNKQISEYYYQLNDDERKRFEKHTSLDKLLNTNNYYFCVISSENKNTFALLIADTEEQKIYYFNAVN